MPKKIKDPSHVAIKLFQKECKAEALGLECALAQLALHCLNLEAAHRADSWQRTMSCLWGIRNEAKNVRRALQLEYPEIEWEKRS